MATDLILRPATNDDYQGVMEIGKISGGRDYLPAQFDKYLKEFSCYVSEINGEIVSFTGDRLIDDGMSFTTAASRVKESYQGQGILRAMLKFQYESYRDIPGVKYEVMTTNNTNPQLAKVKQKYEQILERALHEFVCDAKTFKSTVIKYEDVAGVKELDTEDFKRLFQSATTCARLFPEGRLVANWFPYRLIPENIPLMLDGGYFWATINNEMISTMSSNLAYYLNSTTFCYQLDIYGCNKAELRQHILHHLQNISRLVDPNKCSTIMLHIRCQDNEIKTEWLVGLLQNYGLIYNYFEMNRMMLFERPFQP